MTTKEQIEQDLKQAMLSGHKELTTILRGLKSSIMYEEVAVGKKELGLSDEEVQKVLTKEAKKRQESADIYQKAGEDSRYQQEQSEKTVIQQYLPQQMSDEALSELVETVLGETETPNIQNMGKIIGEVKTRSKGLADGARIASVVKAKLG